ncbi:MAG TPA: protein kinase [Gemmatimonadaceae bacterium]
MGPLTAESTLSTGLFNGRYEIGRELGRGGTAVVHEARDHLRNETVALKLLREALIGSGAAERFLKELRLHQRLDHPSILPVLDSGSHEGQLFLVLPFMEGGTLRDRLMREKQLPLPDVLAITTSIAGALTHVHTNGLLHRDVKPENILFANGQAVLGDFGIARALERAIGDSTTSTGVIRGTPLYMSPEQAAGEGDLDARSDIYSLGCVTYEMLTGMAPFTGPSLESVMTQRLSFPPRPLRAYRASIPVSVERVVLRALVLARADRYQTVTGFADALSHAIAHPDEGQPAPRIHSWRKRVAAGTVAAGLLGVALWKAAQPRPGADEIPAGDPRRIAVLYFDDHTSDKAIGHIAAGLTENLIDQLSQVTALRVTSPNGVRAFRGDSIGLDSIARRLSVGTIISGSVSTSESQLRVTIRLIDAQTSRQLQSRTLQHPLATLFRLQDTLSADVALWLRERLGREVRLRAQAASTNSVAAWEWAQRAEALSLDAGAMVLRSDPRSAELFARADSAFAVAEELDARWPLSTLGRARNAISSAFAYTDRSGRPTAQFNARLREAVRLAELVLSRKAGLAEARAIRGEALMRLASLGNVTPAESLLDIAVSDLRHATTDRPDAARAWYALGGALTRLGKFGEAAEAFRTAYNSDAFLTSTRSVLSELLASMLLAREYEDARRWCKMAQNRYPGDPRFAQCELNILGWTGHTASEASTAWSLLSRIEQQDSTGVTRTSWHFRRMMIAAILARAGLGDSARAVVRRARAERGDRVAAPYPEAYVATLLGDHDAAILLLTQALAASPNDRSVIANHPWYADLRGDPKFVALFDRK